MEALHWSELLQNVVTSIAVVLGGGWAFWKWGYTEWQEAKKNRASLDGNLHVQAESLASGLMLVTVLGQWNNRGQFSVAIDPKKSRVLVYRLPERLPIGPFDPESGLGAPVFVQHPFSELDQFDLEPKTESSLRSHFVLEPDGKYFFRWELYKSPEPGSEHEFLWSKELVWCAASNMTLNADARHNVPRAG